MSILLREVVGRDDIWFIDIHYWLAAHYSRDKWQRFIYCRCIVLMLPNNLSDTAAACTGNVGWEFYTCCVQVFEFTRE